MPIIDSRGDSVTVGKDVKRHHDKIRDTIKDKLPEILSEETILGKDSKGRKIRIPIKSINIPNLQHGKRKKGKGDGDGDGEGQGGSAGIGQGPGKKGDEMGRRPVQGQGEGEGEKAGNDPGEEALEAEFSIEEIIEMMFEDLGLPNLAKKDLATIETVLGYKISGSEHVGPMVLLKKRPTITEAIKTFWALMGALEGMYPNRSELDRFAALKESSGDIGEAEKLLAQDDFGHNYTEVEPFPIMGNDDLRFFRVEEKKTSETNAVVFAILDVSGSMSDHKKYIARAILFWVVQVLRGLYTNVEIKFIVHTSEARYVDEKDFFRTRESGGTVGCSAFKLANELIEEKYPTNMWNVYTFYFSDGDDFYPQETADSMKKMLELGVNMLGFANIKERGGLFNWGNSIIDVIQETWDELVHCEDVETENGSIEVISGKQGFPFLAVTLSKREHVIAVIRELLKKNRW